MKLLILQDAIEQVMQADEEAYKKAGFSSATEVACLHGSSENDWTSEND